MARDKKRDDDHFHCSEEHEFEYVATLYASNRHEHALILGYLEEWCSSKRIDYSKHSDVYAMLEEEGLSKQP